MKSAWVRCLLLAALLAIACSVRTPAPPQDAAAGLGGTSWQLVRFQGSDDKLLTPDEPAKYTIAFGTDGNVSARIDCNRGRGTWKSSGPNQLQFGPLALTRAMCPPGSLHDRIVKDWEFCAVVHIERWPSLSGAHGEFAPIGGPKADAPK